MPISTGINIDRRQELHEILSPLNSGSLICVEFQISSKLKLLQLLLKTIVTIEFTFLRSYSLKDDRCQYWQVSNLTGIENHKKFLSLLNSSLSVEYEISSKLKHLPFFAQNYGMKDDRYQSWQVPRITENYCHQWIQHLQIVHYAKFCEKRLTSFPVPRSPFPFLKIAPWKSVCLGMRKLVQWKKKCNVDLISLPHSDKRYKVSWKQWLNLCSWRWVRSTRNLVKWLRG